jgi:hypothetical protein
MALRTSWRSQRTEPVNWSTKQWKLTKLNNREETDCGRTNKLVELTRTCGTTAIYSSLVPLESQRERRGWKRLRLKEYSNK